jgi:hypothetical protein
VETHYRALERGHRPSPWLLQRRLGAVAVVADPSSLEDGSGTILGQHKRSSSKWIEAMTFKSIQRP